MFKQGEKVIYKKELCRIEAIKEKYYREKDYYMLSSIADPSLIIHVPIDNPKGYLRSILSKEEAEKIVSSIPQIDVVEVNEKYLERIYQDLFNTNSHQDLIKILKTCYFRNKIREKACQKPTDKDKIYFEKARAYLCYELSSSLNISYEEMKQIIMSQLKKENNALEA